MLQIIISIHHLDKQYFHIIFWYNNQRKNHKKYLVMKIMRVLLKVAALSGEGGGKEKGTNEK